MKTPLAIGLLLGVIIGAFIAGSHLRPARAERKPAPPRAHEAVADDVSRLPLFTPPKYPPTLQQLIDGKVPGTYGAKRKGRK